MRILRVFGLSKAEMNSIIENAQTEGSPSLRLQERDGEYLVCVQASAPTQAMADEYCEKWVQKLRTRFGDACYGFEDTTLAQAALDALLKKRRLLVAADEATGRLLGNALRGLQHSEAAFDFGNQTYLNPANARRIAAPEALLKKFPGDMVQAAAGRAQSALLLANADYAAVYMPATVGQAPFVLLCSRIGAAACALSPEISDMAIANHILDLARRRALGMHLGPSAITFKPGRERPLLLVSGEGQPRPGFRFTLRRKAAPAKPAVKPNAPDSYDAEPVPDYDAQPTEPKPQATPTGTITFERPIAQPAAPQPTPDPLDLRTAGPQAAAEARARRAAESELDPDLELCATRTIKISRADLEQAMAAQQAAKQQEQPNPEPPVAPQPEPLPEPEPPANLPKPKASILDDDIPDFSAGLDPAALEAARKADEKAPPRSTDEFQRAASQLFEDDEDDGEDEEPTITFPGRSKAKPAVPRPLAAKQEPKQDTIHNRSLAMIERAERRHRRKAIAAVAVIALLVLVGAAVLLGLTRYEHGEFFSKDSIKLDENLRYSTGLGRPVYGGGGIMPDVFVPQDTTGVSSYLIEVSNRGLIIQFSFQYTDRNRAKLSAFENEQDLLKYLRRQGIVEQFIRFADSKGVKRRNLLIHRSYKLLERNLYGNIIYNTLGKEAYIRYINESDATVKKALEILECGEAFPKAPLQAGQEEENTNGKEKRTAQAYSFTEDPSQIYHYASIC